MKSESENAVICKLRGGAIESLTNRTPSRVEVKVVLIDDDYEDSLIIRNMLSDRYFASYKVEWVSDPTEGLKAIRKQDAAVYLIDYRLGEKTGIDLLNELSDEHLTRPMILLTGFSDHDIDVTAMQAGAWDFLSKTTITAELLERSIRYSMRRADDLIRIREAEKERLQRDLANAANHAKTQFLAHMSHEIRSPLTAILGFTSLAQSPSASDKERLEFLEIIRRSGEHLLRIVNDVLDVSKIEEGKFEIFPEIFDWREATADILDLLKPQALAKGLALNLKVDDDVPLTIASDSHRFRQILINLLSNAIKFTNVGSVELIVRRNPAGSDLDFDIKDTGIGIKCVEEVRLFHPYSQANGSTSRNYGGTGLGLSLSRQIARAMGGDVVRVKTEAKMGSTFRLRLPTHALRVDQRRAPSEDLPVVDGGEKKMKVLLVEDSRDNQLLVSHFLKSANVDLSVADDGKKGVEAAFANDFDAILMDIQMPIVDGYEATRQLRIGGYKNPIIALTAHAFDEEREHVFTSGFDDFVGKPIQKDHLIAALRRKRSQRPEARMNS